MSARPTAPNFASLRNHAVKQDEAHHAAHVEEEYPEEYSEHSSSAINEAYCKRWASGQRERLSAAGTRRWSEAAATVASPRAEFTGKKAHQRKLRPLSRAEWVEQLLFGVVKSGTNGIDRGNRQAHTSRSP